MQILAKTDLLHTRYWPRTQIPLLYVPEFSQQFQHSSTNNIFVNETLFAIYSDFMRKTILPMLGIKTSIAEFEPLHDDNRLDIPPTSILRSYSCIERKLKPLFTAIFSVVVADYAFIIGGLSLVTFISAWYQKRSVQRGISIF